MRKRVFVSIYGAGKTSLLVFLLTLFVIPTMALAANGYTIHSVSINSKTMTVNVATKNDCKLFGALYEENGRMIEVNSVDVSASEDRREIQLDFSREIPSEGYGKAFLLNAETFQPLSESVSNTSGTFDSIAGDFVVEGGILGTDYTFEDGILSILSETAVTIRNSNPNIPTTNRIFVSDGVNANITLAGVNIDASDVDPGVIQFSYGRTQPDYNASALRIAEGSKGNVRITLASGKENYLQSGVNGAGLQKQSDQDSGMLTIDGSGKLTAKGGEYGAGIGASRSSAWNITINGGSVTAISGWGAAGIGGGYHHYSAGLASGNITINNGSVTAISTGYGAGIGGGDGGAAENITITGGTVTAEGRTGGAGIGGGSSGSYGQADARNINIFGGNVTATGGRWGAGVGSGWLGSCDGIQITGGSLLAQGGENAAGIGGCENDWGSCPVENLIINGNCAVFASGGFGVSHATTGASIGTGGGFSYDEESESDEYFNGAEMQNALSKGVVFCGLEGKIYGNVTLTSDITIPAGYTLTIPAGSSLTMTQGATLHNYGTIVRLGALVGNVSGNGDVLNSTRTRGQTGDFQVFGGAYGEDYSFSGGVLTILSGKPITIQTVSNEALGTSDVVQIADGVNANLTLDGVYIDAHEKNYAAIQASNRDLLLTIKGDNRLISGRTHAGVEQHGGALEINGSGNLVAYGGVDGGAGIGTACGDNASSIKISAANIIARGSGFRAEESADPIYASGIGAGAGGQNASIIIESGTIDATIGGAGGNVVINGGSINTRLGNSNEASIGGSGSYVTVNNGLVDSSITGDGIRVTINGGTVEGATKAIGGKAAEILITGGTVNMHGTVEGAAIGGVGSSVTITGGRVIANGGYAGIGSDSSTTYDPSVQASVEVTNSVTITGGVVVASGQTAQAGIGLPENSFENLVISGDCVIFANGGSYSSDIRAAAIGTRANTRNTPYTDGIEVPTDNWHGIVFRNKSGLMYGNSVSLHDDVTIPDGYTLILSAGQQLTIPNGVTLINRGVIQVDDTSCITGTVIGNQPVVG